MGTARHRRGAPGRSRWMVSRRAALGLLGAGAPLLVATPAGARPSRGSTASPSQTNWRAQAEHGGYYQAVAAGLYRDAGLEVELRIGRAAGEPGAAAARRARGHGHVQRLPGAELRAGEHALPLHRRDLPEGPAGPDAPPRRRHRPVRGAARPHHPDRRRRRARPTGPSCARSSASPTTRSGPTPSTCSPSWPTRSDPAGLLCPPSPSRSASRASTRVHLLIARCRLRELRHHHRHRRARPWPRSASSCSASSTPPSGLGPVPEGPGRRLRHGRANALIKRDNPEMTDDLHRLSARA